MSHLVRTALGSLLAALLASCTPQLATAPVPAPPPARPGTVKLTPPGLVCLDKLGQRGALFEIVADRVATNGCSVTNGVRVSRTSVAFDKPATITCQMAIAWSDFEEQVVQPAAQRYFQRR